MLSKVLNTMNVPVRSDGNATLLAPKATFEIEEALFVGVGDHGAGSNTAEHVARRQTVARAAIDDHDLVLADDGHAVGDGNDAAVGLDARRARNEIERHIDAAGESACRRRGFRAPIRS